MRAAIRRSRVQRCQQPIARQLSTASTAGKDKLVIFDTTLRDGEQVRGPEHWAACASAGCRSPRRAREGWREGGGGGASCPEAPGKDPTRQRQRGGAGQPGSVRRSPPSVLVLLNSPRRL